MTSEKASGEARQPAPEPQRVAELCAQALLAGDQASRSFGIRMEDVKPGAARLRMRVRPDMVNGHGICHGGIVFALADSAFAVACNTYNAVTVAAAASIDFLAPVRVNDELTAQAREVWRSKRSGIYEIVRGRSHTTCAQIVPEPVQSPAGRSRGP
jgi:phenylacetic acid degradation protein PaaD